jgi:uncharacterized protein DUF6578
VGRALCAAAVGNETVAVPGTSASIAESVTKIETSVPYPVLVDDWQLQCCGESFAVGDTVSWTLGLIDEAGETYPDEFRVSLPGEAIDLYADTTDWPNAQQLEDTGFRPRMRAVRTGGLTVAVSPTTAAPVSGVLYEDHHGEVPSWMPATSATVLRMYLVSQAITVERGSATGVPKSFATREVERVPTVWSATKSAGGTLRYHDAGLLVYLRID